MADYDVLIAGGGPAGCAMAMSLRDVAPGLRVCIAEPGASKSCALAETLPPPAAAFLKHLGLLDRFERDGHAPAYRTQSAWGSSQLIANEFLYGTHQVGWRIDRGRFDAMMSEGARSCGVAWRPDRALGLTAADAAWSVRFDRGDPVTARYVVDATGRGSRLCRNLGRAPELLDRLVACVVRFAARGNHPVDTHVETFADGWWFASSLPQGDRVIVCLSDSDIVRRERLAEMDVWMRRLGQTQYVRRLVADAKARHAPQRVAAVSQHQSSAADASFIAIGDAASSFDPLSSQGIAKALRSAIFASYSVADRLLRDDLRGIARYRDFIAGEYLAFRAARSDYYSRERRWQDRAFWRRRHAALALPQVA